MAEQITLVFTVDAANEDLDDVAEMIVEDTKRRYGGALVAVEHVERSFPRTYGYLLGAECRDCDKAVAEDGKRCASCQADYEAEDDD